MRAISPLPKALRRAARGLPLRAVAAMAAVAAILPASAAASTVGVPNLEQVPVSNTGILLPPAPYSLWQSGDRDGSTAFYASENGFITAVSVAHWNEKDATVRIYLFRRDGGESIKIVQSVMTMVLPAAPKDAPIITTVPVTSATPIAVGDRIGLTQLSGSSLHAFVNQSSEYPAPGVAPYTAPASEPAVGDSYEFPLSQPTGPLIRGIVSAAPNTEPPPPGGGGTNTPAVNNKPAARPISLPTVKKNRTIVTSAHCEGLGLRSRCTGKVIVELDYQGNVINVTREGSTSRAKPQKTKVLGSASYSIPDGANKQIAIQLNKAGRSTLKQKGKLKAFLVFREEIEGKMVSTGTRFTVKFKQKKKKHAARPSAPQAGRTRARLRPEFVAFFPARLRLPASP